MINNRPMAKKFAYYPNMHPQNLRKEDFIPIQSA